jgi:hypothetical protein
MNQDKKNIGEEKGKRIKRWEQKNASLNTNQNCGRLGNLD